MSPEKPPGKGKVARAERPRERQRLDNDVHDIAFPFDHAGEFGSTAFLFVQRAAEQHELQFGSSVVIGGLCAS